MTFSCSVPISGRITVLVEAEDEKEALQKVLDGNIEDSFDPSFELNIKKKKDVEDIGPYTE